MEARSPETAQLPATQKPQGGFPFLTAFDSIIIPLLQGAFEGQNIYCPLMQPPYPAVVQHHIHGNLLKPLPQQIPPAQDLMVPRIGNLVQRRHNLPPGRPAEVDMEERQENYC